MNPYVQTSNPDPFTSFLNAMFMNPFWGFVVILGIIVVVTLIVREIVCWYWKINEGLDVLNDIKDELTLLNKRVENFQSERKSDDRFTAPSAPLQDQSIHQ